VGGEKAGKVFLGEKEFVYIAREKEGEVFWKDRGERDDKGMGSSI